MQRPQQLLKDACERSEDSEYDVSFRNDYSGRGMYGRNCVGIVGSESSCLKVIAEVIKGAREELKKVQLGSSEHEGDMLFGQVVDTLLNYDRDSMGRSVILYWPQLESIEDEDFDGEDELSSHEGYAPPQM